MEADVCEGEAMQRDEGNQSASMCGTSSLLHKRLLSRSQGLFVRTTFLPRRWRGQAIDASPFAGSEFSQQTAGSAARTELASATPNAQNTAAPWPGAATLTRGGSAWHRAQSDLKRTTSAEHVKVLTLQLTRAQALQALAERNRRRSGSIEGLIRNLMISGSWLAGAKFGQFLLKV